MPFIFHTVFQLSIKNRPALFHQADVDVIMVAPKGSGTSVRANFIDGSGINSSFAVFQDATGRATERTLALGDGRWFGISLPHHLPSRKSYSAT